MRFLMAFMFMVLALTFVGCSSFPSGASNDYHVFTSSEHLPKRIEVYDTVSNRVLWSKDVPVGKKLVMKFDTFHAYDGKLATGSEPKELRWEVLDYGKHNVDPKNVHELSGNPVMIKMIVIEKEASAATQPSH